jgi:hypothetical protein
MVFRMGRDYSHLNFEIKYFQVLEWGADNCRLNQSSNDASALSREFRDEPRGALATGNHAGGMKHWLFLAV